MVFLPLLCFIIHLFQGRCKHGISDGRFLRMQSSFPQPFCPSLRLVYQSKFRTIPSLIQVPRMTNDRGEICEHNSQLQLIFLLRENYIFTFLCIFFFSPFHVVEHCHEDDPAVELLWITLSFFPAFMNLFEEAKCCESLEYFPFKLHRNSISTIQIFQMITLEIPLSLLLPSLVRVLFYTSQDRAPSRRRRRSWPSWSDKLCHTISLSSSMCALSNQSWQHHWFLSDSWSIFQFLWKTSSKNSRNDS